MAGTNLVQNILDSKSIQNLKQPIVSIKEKRIVGYEALSRGVDPGSGEVIQPDVLFRSAKECGISLEIDRICREKAVSCFSKLYKKSDFQLFVNFNPEVLNYATLGSCWMKNIVEQYGLAPFQVAIEIVESKVESQKDLEAFVEMYRRFGFMIVLDDFGAEHSNLNRVVQVKPDIIKIDRELIQDISKDSYKRSVVGAVIDLAGKTGAMSLVEGVEDPEDVIVCHEMGADLFQGYFFSRPSDNIEIISESCNASLEEVFALINRAEEERLSERQVERATCKIVSGWLCSELSEREEDKFDKVLQAFADTNARVECVYILSENGIQLSETHRKKRQSTQKNCNLFKPSTPGTDHSLKNYFTSMRFLNLPEYYSEPYISLATGNLCRTMSVRFETTQNKACIACIDFSSRL